MKIETWIGWVIRDRNDKIISSSIIQAHSIVRGFIDILHANMSQLSVTNGWTDTGGTNRNTAVNVINFMINAASLDGTFGLVVGTGTGAVTISDTSLVSKIAHGNGAGQLSHGATTFTDPQTSAGTRRFTVQRTFTNNSGSSITVNEVGIYAKAGSVPYIILIERALSSKTIANGTTATLTYTLGVTV